MENRPRKPADHARDQRRSLVYQIQRQYQLQEIQGQAHCQSRYKIEGIGACGKAAAKAAIAPAQKIASTWSTHAAPR